jgi:hypothetical protein
MTVAPGVTDVIIQYLQIDGNRAIIASRPMGQPDIDGYTPPPEIQPTGCPGGNLGSADLELSANSATVTIRTVGPPMWVRRTSIIARARPEFARIA